MGAWIETLLACFTTDAQNVAPRVGAWIETVIAVEIPALRRSLPVWERGLKLYLVLVSICLASRSPCGSVD